jgi:hypothetical protein
LASGPGGIVVLVAVVGPYTIWVGWSRFALAALSTCSLPALDRLAPPFERAMKFFVVRTSVAGGFHGDALSEVLCKCNTNLAGIVVLKRDAVLRERIADFRHLVSLYAGDRFFHPAQC